MRWQQEIHEILEKANWPPTASDLAASPWPRVVALALIGWAVAELLARAGDNARGPFGHPGVD
jgi:hypothetical protein